MSDNLKNVWNTLRKSGYNPPAYESFEKDMQDDNNLKNVYSTLKREGFTPPEYDTFKTDMGVAASKEAQPVAKTTQTEQPVVEQSAAPIVSKPVMDFGVKGQDYLNGENNPYGVDLKKPETPNIPIPEANPNMETPKEEVDELDSLRNKIAAQQEETNAQLGEARKEAKNQYFAEEDEARKQGFWKSLLYSLEHNIARGGDVLGAMERESMKRDYGVGNADLQQKIGSLEAAQRLNEQSLEFLDEAKKEDEKRARIKETARGFGDRVLDKDVWDQGRSQLIDSATMLAIKEKMDKNEPITPEEGKLLEAYANSSLVQEQTADKVSGWYASAGRGSAESLPFMAEFMTNPMSSAGKEASTVLARRFITKYGTDAIKKNALKKTQYLVNKMGSRLLKDVAGSILMSETTGALGVWADTFDRMNGDVEFDIDNGGNVNITGISEGDDFFTARRKALTARSIENFSEMVGEYFLPAGKAVVDLAAKNKTLGKVIDAISHASNNKLGQFIKSIEDRASFRGQLGEWAEEVIGSMMNAAFVGDQSFSRYKKDKNGEYLIDPNTGERIIDQTYVFDKKNLADTFMALLPITGSNAILKSAGGAYHAARRNVEREVSRADATGSAIYGNSWAGVKEAFDNAKTEDEMKMAINNILDNEPDKAKRDAALNYYGKQLELLGATITDAKNDSENFSPYNEIADEGFSTGYLSSDSKERNRYNVAYRLKLDKTAKDLGISPEKLDAMSIDELRGFVSELPSTERKQAEKLYGFINAKSRLDGMIAKAQDDIDAQVTSANATIDTRTNANTGKVSPAILKDGDKKVYILGGEAVMAEDGEHVDGGKSSQDLIVMDEEGNKSFVSAMDIKSVEEGIDAAQLKEETNNQIAQQIATNVENELEGRRDYQPGENITLSDGRTGEVISSDVDNVYVAAPSVEGKEAETIPVSREELQAANNALVEAELAAEEEDAAQYKPDYAPGEMVTLRTPEGELVEAEVNPSTEGEGIYEVIHGQQTVNGEYVNQLSKDELDQMVVARNGQPVEPAKVETPVEEQAAVEPVQSAVEEEAKKPAMERLAKDESGQPIFERSAPEDTFEALSDIYKGDADKAQNNASQMVKVAEKELESLQKEEVVPGTNPLEIAANEQAHEDAIAAAQQKVDYWKNIVAYANNLKAEKAAEAEAEAEAKNTQFYKASALAEMAIEKRDTNKAIAKEAKRIARKLGARVKFIADVSEVTNKAAIREIAKMAKGGPTIRGWQSNGMSYIFLPGIQSVDDLRSTLKHETITHLGFRDLLDQDEGGYDGFCQFIYDNVMDESDKQFFKHEYNGEISDAAAADEWIAHVVQDVDFNFEPTVWEKIKEKLADILSYVGINVNNNEDVDVLKQMMRDAYNKEKYLSKDEAAKRASINSAASVEKWKENYITRLSNAEIRRRDKQLQKSIEEADTKVVENSEEKEEGFGTIFRQFKGKTKEAIAFLLNRKEGKAVAALYHPEVGDIDIWYGNDKAGLKRIAEKHSDILDNLQETLNGMNIIKQSDNRIILEGNGYRAIISKMLGDKKTDNWLLSAYEKEGVPASSSDIETGSSEMGNGTAASQNASSTVKGTNSQKENNTLLSKVDDVDNALAFTTGRNAEEIHKERVEILDSNINKQVGGQIQLEDDESAPVRFSIVAMVQGAGFEPIENDGNNNFAIRIGDKIFDHKHHVTGKDIEQHKNCTLNYLINASLALNNINEKKAKQIRDKYASLLNSILDKGVARDGISGYDYLSSQWQYVAETVYKTVAPNGDKQYSFSLDITRVCKKNEAVIKAIASMQRQLGYGATPGQIMDIYLSSIEEGYQVPCPVCYVFSRYINNGKYATVAILGQKKYGDKLVDPSTLSEAEKKEKIDYWLNELDKQQKANKKYGKAITKAQNITTRNYDLIDKLTEEITSGKLSEDEKKAKIEQVHKLDAEYKAALDLVSQSRLDKWIKRFAIRKTKNGWKLWDDTFQGFPEENALDLRLTADTMRNYPAIQRLRNSFGPAGGKEITFDANNDLGEVALMLGKSNRRKVKNYFKMAAEAQTEKERAEYLDKANKEFATASLYAHRQTLRGGQRMWSWSDNIERLAPDVAINLMQMELLGGALQSYSKQLEGINLVARMNGYVNGSLMGKGGGYVELTSDKVGESDGKLIYTGEDMVEVDAKGVSHILTKTGAPVFESNGKYYTLVFDDVVGIDAFGKDIDGKHLKGLFELNQELDKAGNILVGMNDNHVRTALADDRIFFVIPWHASGNSIHILNLMFEYLTVDTDFEKQDYTAVQEEKYADPTKTAKKDSEEDKDDLDKEEEVKILGAFTKVNGKKVINPYLIELWERVKNETEFKCGIEGGIPSGKDGDLSAEQRAYKRLRDGILIGEKMSKRDLAIIANDEFLSQVKRRVDEAAGREAMTKSDTDFIYPYEYWDETTTYETADKNTERYLEYCRRLGYKPKFSGKLDGKPEKDFGNFTGDKGYWKLLIDRRMYDVNGNYQWLDPVNSEGFEPEYTDPEWTEQQFVKTVVADDPGAERVAQRAIEKEEKRPGGVAQVHYEKTLDEAADDFEKTMLSKVYHGSGAEFDKFDEKFMSTGEGNQAYGWGTYVTTNKDTAIRYAEIGAGNKLDENAENVKYVGDNSFGLEDGAADSAARYVAEFGLTEARKMYQQMIDDLGGVPRSKFESDVKFLLDISSEKDFTDARVGNRHLYEVEIPDDNGFNYLHWDEPMTMKQAKAIQNEIVKQYGDQLKETYGDDYMREIKSTIGYGTVGAHVEGGLNYLLGNEMDYATGIDRGAKRNSILLSDAGIVGMEVAVDRKNGHQYAGSNYVIYDNSNADITGHTAFSKVNNNQEMFVSNAEMAVESLNMGKATGEQWLKAIQGKGGLKAGEDKWLGLSQWLGEQTKPVSREEVLKFIEENRIKIEETKYGELDPTENVKGLEKYNEEYRSLMREAPEDEDPVDYAYAAMARKYGNYFWDTFSAGEEEISIQWDNYDNYERARKDLAEYGITFDTNAINPTRLEYTTSGLDNNREIALTIPTIESWNESDKIHFGDAGEGRAVSWIRFGETTEAMKGRNAREINDMLEKKYGHPRAFDKMTDEDVALVQFANYLYRDEKGADIIEYFLKKDFGEERAAKIYSIFNNLVAENDAKKNTRVLVIDEIQSKRHQEGREKGYADIDAEQKFEELIKESQAYQQSLADKYKTDVAFIDGYWTEDEQQKIGEFTREKKRYADMLVDGIPAAPFEKNWHELAMKRMLRLAAEEGYDKIAWTSGEMQADRYDLSKRIKEVAARADGNGNYYVVIEGTDGFELPGYEGSGKKCTAEEMTSIFGKDLGKRLIEGAESSRGQEWKGKGNNPEFFTIKEDGLKIGGEGMKGFYDEILPRFMDKYGKKWNVRTQGIELPVGKGMWHSVDVTPEMKKSVMEGQTMFSIIGPKGALRLADYRGTRAEEIRNGKIAIQMEKEGKTPREIKLATGWERGKDRGWRYELPDFKIKDIKAFKASTRPTLDEVIDYPELFAAYPELKDFKLRFYNKGTKLNGTVGAMNWNYKEIVLAWSQLKNTPYEMSKEEVESLGYKYVPFGSYQSYLLAPNGQGRKTLIHEIQHAIQRVEGFAKGSNSSKYVMDADSLETLYEQAKKDLKKVKKLVEKARSTEEYKNYIKLGDDPEASYETAREAFKAYYRTKEYEDCLEIQKEFARNYGIMPIAFEDSSKEEILKAITEQVSYKNYWNQAGEVEARNAEKRAGLTGGARKNLTFEDTEDVPREEQIVNFSKVTDPEVLKWFNEQPKEVWYGSMTLLNPEETDKSKWRFAPVKSAKDSSGKMRETSALGQLERSDEDLEGLKNGKYDLKDVDNDTVGGVNYNPYFHLSDSLMNDQFTGAYNKPNTVVVKFLVPKSELYPSGEAYKAEGANNSVGVLPWHSGTINAQLPKDKQRRVALSRWRMPIDVVSNEEVAKFIAKKLEEANTSMPWNLVTPGVLEELDKLGAPISEGAGSVKMKGAPRPDVQFSKLDMGKDEQFIKAIEEGDNTKVKKLLIERAKETMPDTKVVDKKGNPLIVYHGTPNAPFTKFEGDFFFFTKKQGNADEYKYTRTFLGPRYSRNGHVVAVFLNITNPLVIDVHGGWNNVSRNRVYDMLDIEYTKEAEEKIYKSKYYSDVYYTKDKDERINTNDVCKLAKERGYDGVIFTNIADHVDSSDHTQSDVYVAFSPNQVKDLGATYVEYDGYLGPDKYINSPVGPTFNDNGNVIPLSQRMDTNTDDMRFSKLSTNELHEIADKVSGSKYDQFAMSIFNNNEEIRKQMVDMARGMDWNFLKASKKYLSGLADVWEPSNEQKNIYDKARELFDANLSDNEMRYLLWYKGDRDKGAFGVADDIVMQKNLEVGDFKNDGVQFSKFSIFRNNGKRSQQNSDGRSERIIRSAVAGDPARKLAIRRDLWDIQGYRDGLAARSSEYSLLDSQIEKERFVSETLVNRAKEAGQYIAWGKAEKMGLPFKGKTMESLVMRDGNRIVKLKDPFAASAIKGNEPIDAIIEHVVHNILFSNTPYKFLGITEDYKGDMRFVLEQPFIKSIEEADQNDVADFLENNLGLIDEGREQYGNNIVSVIDAFGENVLINEDGELNFIDPIIKLKSNGEDIIDTLLGEETLFSKAQDEYNNAVRIIDENGNKKASANLWWRLKEAYTDSMKSLKELQAAIERESGKPIKDFENAYIAENAMSSKNQAGTDEFHRDFMEPIKEVLGKLYNDGVAHEDIVKYLMAKHGLERNEVFQKREEDKLIAERNAKLKALDSSKEGYEEEHDSIVDDYAEKIAKTHRDYAGLTELTGSEDSYADMAQDIVDRFESAHNTKDLWRRINDATKRTLEINYAAGLMTKESYEKVRDMFDYYIPLRGWDDNVAKDIFDYMGSDEPIREKSVKTAKGRTSVANDPIAYIGKMGYDAVALANRNLMKQRLLNLAMNHPTDLLTVSEQWYAKNALGEWEGVSPDIEEDATPEEIVAAIKDFEEKMKKASEEGNATKRRNGLKLVQHATSYEKKQHEIRVRRAGKEFIIYVNGNPRAAQAVNGLTNPSMDSNAIKQTAQDVKNLMAQAFTSMNPAFIFANLSRDTMFATTAVIAKENGAYSKQFVRNYARNLKSMMGLIKKLNNGTLDDNVAIERYFHEFVRNGGETGYTNIVNVDTYKKELKRFEKEITSAGVKTMPKQVWEATTGAIEFMNRTAEDITRFAVFMTSRQMGRSVARSVWDAKEITVNFNKKGSGGYLAQTMNFAYIFFNACVQSAANVGRIVKAHPGKAGAAFATYLTAGMLQPIVLLAMQAMLGYGDDDDEMTYWDLPEWVRRNNLVFWIPGTNGYITIPISQELRPLYGIGEIAASCMFGKEDVEEGIKKGAEGLTGILPIDVTGNGGNLAINLTPTVGQPIAQLIANTDFFGTPIYKKGDYNKENPDWTKAYKGTSAFLVNGSKFLSDITGGDNVEKGAIDLNPAVVEHLFEGYLGGLGKTVNRSIKMVSMLWNEDQRMMRNVPVVSNFVQVPDERNTGSQLSREYYELLDEYDKAAHKVNGYQSQMKKEGGVYAEEYGRKLTDYMETEDFKRYWKMRGYVNAINNLNKKKKNLPQDMADKMDKEILSMKKEMIEAMKTKEDNK